MIKMKKIAKYLWAVITFLATITCMALLFLGALPLASKVFVGLFTLYCAAECWATLTEYDVTDEKIRIIAREELRRIIDETKKRENEE